MQLCYPSSKIEQISHQSGIKPQGAVYMSSKYVINTQTYKKKTENLSPYRKSVLNLNNTGRIDQNKRSMHDTLLTIDGAWLHGCTVYTVLNQYNYFCDSLSVL